MNLKEAIKEIKYDNCNDCETLLRFNENCDGCHYKCAIEAMEKQIPKKPNKAVETSWGIKRDVNVCPVCDYYLNEIEFIGNGKKVSYCEVCGQAIDWKE